MISDKEISVYKKKYAKLIAVKGLNDILGKVCKIQCDIDDPEFITDLVNALYDRGARRVEVYWHYRPIVKTIYQHTTKEELSKVYKPEVARLQYELDELMPSIYIESEIPSWMNGVDPVKVAESTAAHQKVRRPYKIKMDAVETPWCIATIPGPEWAKSLFPKLSKEDAVRKLWEKIIICCRLKGDPIKNWEKYNKDIKARAKWLDSLKIKTLHYTSKNGTDLTVGIHKDVHFCGGAHDSIGNPPYNPNMPAVECFTTPDKYITEGVAVASKPLAHNGSVIEGFKVYFHKGRIVKVTAKKGEVALKKIVETDEGSHYLGEAALVPFDSPVSNTNMVYYKTILDENAACHLAMGCSISTTYNKPLRGLNAKELDKVGINSSNTHVDFMIGCKDLNIVATTRSGKKVQIFKNGNWAKKL